jgi:hypothetical protein
MLGLGAALHRRLDPLDDLAVAVGLQSLELQLVDVLGERSYPSGGSCPPVHVIFETASVTSPNSVLIGFGSGVFSTEKVHPDFTSTLTDGIGWSAGNVTSRLTVDALSFSVGTRKLKLVVDPFGALSGSISTCAAAGPATKTTRASPRTAPRTTRRTERLLLMTWVPPRVSWTVISRPLARQSSGRRRGLRVARPAAQDRGGEVDGDARSIDLRWRECRDVDREDHGVLLGDN